MSHVSPQGWAEQNVHENQETNKIAQVNKGNKTFSRQIVLQC